MENLAQEMVEMAENGCIQKTSRSSGNLGKTAFFRECAARISESPRQSAASIDERMNIETAVAPVRARIESLFKRLHRDAPAKPSEVFSAQFLRDFDFVTKTRTKAIRHAVSHQCEFVLNPMNPMLLRNLRQEDVAQALGCHVSTISRLFQGVSVTFPDTVERDVALLIPGNSLVSLQGRYALGMLSKNQAFFDCHTKTWLIDDETLRRKLHETFGIQVKPRTVRKYKQWFNECVFGVPAQNTAPVEDGDFLE
jgi:transcriptional regulator with XRE-family HTH domain